MRVGHVISGDLWAGAEVQVWQLLRHLPERGVEPHVAVFNGGVPADRFLELGVPVTLVDEQALRVPTMIARLRAWVRGGAFDLLHTHGYKEHILSAWALGRAGGPPLIRTLHGAAEPGPGRDGVRHSLQRRVDTRILRRRTAAIIAVSSDLAVRAGATVGHGLLHTIHNGVDLEPYAVSPEPEAHPPRLGFFGRLVPVKAVDRLIRAMPLVRAAVPGAELWIVGEGPERPALHDLARDLDVGDRVHFAGFQADVLPLLHAVDVVVLASEHEGLPMIVLEAGAAGKPLVAPRVGGLPEVVRDRDTGTLLAEPTPEALAAACVPLLRDPARAAALGAAARARVAEHFSAAATATATAALYADVLAAGRRAPRGVDRE